jgi:polysaccharide export outer membrane protein
MRTGILPGMNAAVFLRAARLVCRIAVIAVIAVVAPAACASSTKGAINIDQYTETAPPTGDQYVISIGDVLNVQVFEQERMSGQMRVRSDGRITVPLLNDVVAAGKTPTALATDLESQLKTLILSPKVTVSVIESTPLKISVLGEVAKPGPQDLRPGSGVAEAIANAGGLTNFAHKDRIFVLRSDATPVRIHFTYDAITRAEAKTASFKLRAGDVVVIE